jgi:hypothetical protein
VHYPVLDRERKVVTSAITNIDMHDISRSALSFGLSQFYVVHPVTAQRVLAERVRRHWVEGAGGKRIPDRKPALEIMQVCESVEQASAAFAPDTEIWTTSARRIDLRPLPLLDARKRLQEPGPPVLIVFGTGWGLAPEVHERAAHHLEPIPSPRPDGYNHLSVRAAAAILFDRLLGA